MSFPRYPAYKDSGVEWLEEVPAHWFVGRAKHVCNFFTGWTPPTGNSASYIGDNLWANISDLGPKWLLDTTKAISDEAVRASGIQVSKEGSLLFSFKLSIGQVSFAGRDLYTNEAIATFPPSERLWLPFAYYALPLFLVKNASENIYGAKLLNQELMRAAPVVLPGTEEQKSIATFLDHETAKIDALVAEQERLIELLKEKRQAVISHAVTKGLDSSVPMKDSGVEWLGDVPAHWEVLRIKQLTAFAGGGTPSRDVPEYWHGEIPWVSPKDMKTEFIVDSEERITDDGLRSSTTSLIPIGAVLMVVRSGILKHTIPVAINQQPVALNQDMKALRFDSSRIAALYFLRFVQGLNDTLLLEWSKQGATVESIEHEYLANSFFPVPPILEQTTIANFLDQEIAKLNALMAEAQSAITLLQERRTALISAAVTGQIDVRGWTPLTDAP